jgi:hypothetical protein
VFLAPSGCPTQGVGVTREWGAPGYKPGKSDVHMGQRTHLSAES